MLIETEDSFIHPEDIVELYKPDSDVVFMNTKYTQKRTVCDSHELALLKFEEINEIWQQYRP